MKRALLAVTDLYQKALHKRMKRSPAAGLESANGLGKRALRLAVKKLALAKGHALRPIKQVLADLRAEERSTPIGPADAHRVTTNAPLEAPHGVSCGIARHLQRHIRMLSERTVELASANLGFMLEIDRRHAIEVELKKSERRSTQLLRLSERFQAQRRMLSRQIIGAHEEERKRISRELHDVIAQALTAISLRLATLKVVANDGSNDLEENIASTQQLVQDSVKTIHQFARELRPAVLDDLGLIPALHSYMKTFTKQTGVRTRLIAFAGVEKVDIERRTVLYRVAQEGLTNVSRHANASQAAVCIRKNNGDIIMTIEDDGTAFRAQRGLVAKSMKRLGLLGMRERLEMVGGSFAADSVPGQGTTITARIHPTKGRRLAEVVQRKQTAGEKL